MDKEITINECSIERTTSVKKFLDRYINEDAPANNVGGGHIAMPIKPMDVYDHGSFAGCKVFDCADTAVWKSRHGKNRYHRYSPYVGTDEIGEEIRQYGRENPRRGIVLRNSKTGEMVFLRRPIK